jgi:putative ABC transport system substrate-binding protein
MKRREFITLVGGASIWPLAARAQQGERMRRIGVLSPLAADDPEEKARLAAFAQGFQQLGWTVGQNVRIEYRWSGGNADTMRKYAAELVALAPDVILAGGALAVGPLLQATRTVPIVFTLVLDPVGAGFVDSLARPGGNATGFLSTEYGIGAKWLELLKEIAPRVKRAAVLRDPATASGAGLYGAIQSVAPSFGVDLSPVNIRDAVEIERIVTAFARTSNGGLIVPGSGRLPAGTNCPRSISGASSLPPAASSHMGLIWSINIDARPVTSTASSKARSPPTCRCRRRPSTSWSSISRPPRHSGSKCRRRCSPAPTR